VFQFYGILLPVIS